MSDSFFGVHLNCDLSQILLVAVAVVLLIKMASNCNLGSHYMDCDVGRSTLGRCFLYINMHSVQGGTHYMYCDVGRSTLGRCFLLYLHA